MTASVTPVNDAAPVPPRKRAYHERMVGAFIEHTRLENVANAVPCSVRTVQRWRAVPEWWAEVEAARGEVVRDAIARLRNGLPHAAERLVKVARESPADGVAVRAALAVIEAHGHLTERTELERRLAALEAALAQRAAPSAAPRRPALLSIPSPA